MTAKKPIRYESAFGPIRLVTTPKTGALTYMQKGGHQTAVDRNGISVDTYIHALYSLILQAKARKVLMIGCGGGSLATLLSRAGKSVTVVDIDKVSFKVAKRHFHMPRDIPCHVSDGLAHMQKTHQRYDVIIMDAFVGERVPSHIAGDALCDAVRKCLRPNGAMFMNVCLNDRADLRADKIFMRFKKDGWRVRLLDTPRVPARNGLVLAGNVKGLKRPKIIVVPEIETKRLKRELAAMRYRKSRISQKKTWRYLASA